MAWINEKDIVFSSEDCGKDLISQCAITAT